MLLLFLLVSFDFPMLSCCYCCLSRRAVLLVLRLNVDFSIINSGVDIDGIVARENVFVVIVARADVFVVTVARADFFVVNVDEIEFFVVIVARVGVIDVIVARVGVIDVIVARVGVSIVIVASKLYEVNANKNIHTCIALCCILLYCTVAKVDVIVVKFNISDVIVVVVVVDDVDVVVDVFIIARVVVVAAVVVEVVLEVVSYGEDP